MLEAHIDNILAAETNAAKAIQKAEAKAAAIRLATDTAVAQKREDFLLNNASSTKNAVSAAQKKADTDYNTAIAETEKKVAELTKTAKKNEAKAVELILNNL